MVVPVMSSARRCLRLNVDQSHDMCETRSVASLVDLLTPESVDDLATPANARLGSELAEAGEVELLDAGSQRVKARIGGAGSGSQRRNVELSLSKGQLDWACTCTSDRRLFCKHLVAAALALPENMPARSS